MTVRWSCSWTRVRHWPPTRLRRCSSGSLGESRGFLVENVSVQPAAAEAGLNDRHGGFEDLDARTPSVLLQHALMGAKNLVATAGRVPGSCAGERRDNQLAGFDVELDLFTLVQIEQVEDVLPISRRTATSTTSRERSAANGCDRRHSSQAPTLDEAAHVHHPATSTIHGRRLWEQDVVAFVRPPRLLGSSSDNVETSVAARGRGRVAKSRFDHSVTQSRQVSHGMLRWPGRAPGIQARGGRSSRGGTARCGALQSRQSSELLPVHDRRDRHERGMRKGR